MLQPADIHGIRKLSNGTTEVLVHWLGLPAFKDTWESAEVISTQFPHFHLEDKVKLYLGGY